MRDTKPPTEKEIQEWWKTAQKRYACEMTPEDMPFIKELNRRQKEGIKTVLMEEEIKD